MNEITGELWVQRNAIIVITTNGGVRRDGACVMGRGCARTARDRFAGLDQHLGSLIREHGNRAFRLGTWDGIPLASMPVKHNWSDTADVDLITTSARQLVEMADKFHWERIVVPRPGCGNGGLDWDDVRPHLADVLDDRFDVITW